MVVSARRLAAPWNQANPQGRLSFKICSKGIPAGALAVESPTPEPGRVVLREKQHDGDSSTGTRDDVRRFWRAAIHERGRPKNKTYPSASWSSNPRKP